MNRIILMIVAIVMIREPIPIVPRQIKALLAAMHRDPLGPAWSVLPS